MTLLRALGGEELRHGGLARDAGGAVVLGPGGAIDQQRRRIDVERHLGDVALHHLQIGERAAEQFARAARARRVSSSARRAKPSAAAPTVARKISSVAIAILKPSPGAPIIADSRHRDALEFQPRQRMRRDDIDALGDRKARQVGRDQKGRKPLGAGAFAGSREHDIEIGDAAVGDPGLLAVEHIAVAVTRLPSSRYWRRRSRISARSARTRRWPGPCGCA